MLKYLCGSVSKRLKADQVFGRTVTVSVKTGNFKRHSAQMQLESSINDEQHLFKYAKELSDKLLGGEGLGSPTLSRQELLDLLG